MLPVFPLPETVVFPGLLIPLYIFEERYKQMVKDLLQEDKGRFVIALASPDREYRVVGGVVELVAVSENPDGTYNLLTRGTERVRLLSVDRRSQPYLLGQEEAFPLERTDAVQERLLAWDALEAYREFMKGKADPEAMEEAIANLPDDPLYQASFLCVNLGAPAPERQAFLEAPSLVVRFERLLSFMQNPRDGSSVSA